MIDADSDTREPVIEPVDLRIRRMEAELSVGGVGIEAQHVNGRYRGVEFPNTKKNKNFANKFFCSDRFW